MNLKFYTKCFEYTLKKEGGKSWHAKDKGGATNKGVTLATLRRVANEFMDYDFDIDNDGDVDIEDLWLLSDKDVFKIGQTYWQPLYDELLDITLVIKVFDCGFLCGTRVATLILQRAINDCLEPRDRIIEDGKLGPITVNMANAMDRRFLIPYYCQEMAAFLKAIVARDPSQQVFLMGWLNRAKALPEEGWS